MGKELPPEKQPEGILSPFRIDEVGNVYDPAPEVEMPELPIIALPTEEQMQEIVQKMKDKHVTDETLNRILAETHSQSAIIITFDRPLVEQRFAITDFHIAVANVAYNNVRSILNIVLEALRGRLGGSMHLRKKDGDEPEAIT